MSQALCAEKEMIYVQEKTFEKQIELLSYLSENEKLNICGWLFPESNEKMVLGNPVVRSELEAVTTYSDGFKPYHTQPQVCSIDYISQIVASKKSIVAHCDSLALYRQGTKNWLAATIGHEGMCLVRDNTLLNQLLSRGFNASETAPNWW